MTDSNPPTPLSKLLTDVGGLATDVDIQTEQDGASNWSFQVTVAMSNTCAFTQGQLAGTTPPGETLPSGCYPLIVSADYSCDDCRRTTTVLPYSPGPDQVGDSTAVYVYVMENGKITLCGKQDLYR